jgi:hypothetical protein
MFSKPLDQVSSDYICTAVKHSNNIKRKKNAYAEIAQKHTAFPSSSTKPQKNLYSTCTHSKETQDIVTIEEDPLQEPVTETYAEALERLSKLFPKDFITIPR